MTARRPTGQGCLEVSQIRQPASERLFRKAASLIERSRQRVAAVANTAMVYTYFEIGRLIVEEEQRGAHRAEYGRQLIKELARRLSERFGNGFSDSNLKLTRRFYQVYSRCPSGIEDRDDTGAAVRRVPPIGQSPITQSPAFALPWTHDLVLMRMDDPDERRFYEIESVENQWSVRTLSRQYHSSLYERLALSRNKDAVMKLARKGQTVERPQDVLKNPLVLEFLGMDERASYSESDLEHAKEPPHAR